MKTFTSLALAATVTAGALSAQTIETGVYPADYELVDANTSDHLFPLSWNAPSRQMMLYEPDAFFMGNPLDTGLPVPDGAKITKIGFRKNAAHNSTGKQVKFQIWMGDAALTAENASSTFANNFFPGTDVKVFDGFVALPDLNAGSTEYMITLDTPFTYNGSRGLVVDFRTEINSNANGSFNYHIDVANSNGWVSNTTTFGQGCAGSGGNVPALTIDRTRVGGNMTLRFTKGTASTLVASHLAFDTLMTPIVDPTVAGQCQLWIIPLALVGGTTNTAGNRNDNVPVPNDPSLKGLEVFAQSFIADFFANSLGAVSSNAASVTLGVQPQATLIRQTGTLPTSGGIARNWSPVTLLEWEK